ncbi:MAG TPA: cation acetate symporter [Microbacteriaceae bacterium]|nr:cation acetate symporter [Microbacteriaceae bacterium]
MNPTLNAIGIIAVLAATLGIGVFGLRISRTTSDFYVASRSVRPWLNASAIGGEYLSAASFLGIAGLIFTQGDWGLWFPVGYTAGYLLLLLFVAAPLRRSGAYTLPDFTGSRLESVWVRRLTSVLVVVIGWLYIVPQLQGASLALGIAAGVPDGLGGVVVALIVSGLVAVGGMRSITYVQAFQYWFKLVAIAVPALLVFILAWQARPSVVSLEPFVPVGETHSTLATFSLVMALLLGTMGLPHVLVRFTTNPNGESTRRTTVIVLVLLTLFYAMPTAIGLFGRAVAPDALGSMRSDALVILLPSALLPGPVGEAASALVIAGAFAAFLATSSGLVISLAGVLSQEFAGGTVRGFRWAGAASTAVPLAVTFMLTPGNLAGSVGLVFAFTAATVTPVILLAVWWRGFTARGAIVGMATGAVVTTFALVSPALGWTLQPAFVAVPLAFAAAVLASRLDSNGAPRSTLRAFARMHTPD